MIRMHAITEDGIHLIILGLSEDNVRELKKKRPIIVKGSTVNVPDVDVLIMYGETEYDITEELASFINNKTEIRKIKDHELPPDHRDWKPK